MQKFLRLGNSHRFFLIFILFRTDFLFDRNYTMDRSTKKELSLIFSYFLFYFETNAKFLRSNFQILTIHAIDKFSSIFSYFHLILNRIFFRSKLHNGSFDKKGISIDFFLFPSYFEPNFFSIKNYTMERFFLSKTSAEFLFDRNYTMNRSTKEEFSSIFFLPSFYFEPNFFSIENYTMERFFLSKTSAEFLFDGKSSERRFESICRARRAWSRAHRSAHEYSPDPGS